MEAVTNTKASAGAHLQAIGLILTGTSVDITVEVLLFREETVVVGIVLVETRGGGCITRCLIGGTNASVVSTKTNLVEITFPGKIDVDGAVGAVAVTGDVGEGDRGAASPLFGIEDASRLRLCGDGVEAAVGNRVGEQGALKEKDAKHVSECLERSQGDLEPDILGNPRKNPIDLLMSAAFRPKSSPNEKGKRSGGFLKPQGVAFQGAMLAGLAAGLLTWGGGKYLMHVDSSAQAKESGIALRAHAEAIAKGVGRIIDRDDEKRALEYLHDHLARIPGGTAFLLDEAGKPLLPGAPEGGANSLESPREVEDGILLGSVGRGKVLEIRQGVSGRLLPLGTLYLRQNLHAPVWAGGILPLAQWTSLISAVGAFFFLSFSMRGTRRLHRVLDRAGAGDFYERAPVVGCKEIRDLVVKAHKVLQSVGAAQEEAQKVYVETAIALSKTIEAKDRYTSGHSQRVAVYSVEMGQLLNFDEERLETLRLGALLHDIGKVAVPDDVLLKPGALDDEEFKTMKRHPMAGDRILSAIPGLRDMADIARSHHEKWDGSGYPLGVSGDSIPLEARICAIADAYDALITKRSYKPAMPVAKALNIIENDAGTHFDPELSRLFVTMKRNGKGYKPLPKETAAEGAPSKPAKAS